MAAGRVTQQSDRVRVGIVGGGRIADLNVIGWLEHPAGEVTAVCDVDEATRTRRAAEWGCKAYANLDEMLADPHVDAVEILTPHHLHMPHAIAALRAGKHVSLQKPPTRSLAEFDAVAAAAAEAGTTFKVYENFMFYPPHVLARSLIDAGEIGDVLSVRIVTAAGRLGTGQGWDVPAASNAWRIDPSLCGGGMMTFDHGFHCFQMGRFFVDHPIDTVHAFINVFDLGDGRQLDMPALISWRYACQPAALRIVGGDRVARPRRGLEVLRERRPHRDPRQQRDPLDQPLLRRNCSRSRPSCSTAPAKSARSIASRPTGRRRSATPPSTSSTRSATAGRRDSTPPRRAPHWPLRWPPSARPPSNARFASPNSSDARCVG